MLPTLLLTACGFFGEATLSTAVEGARQEPAKELKILARATWPYAKVNLDAPAKHDRAVIRTAAELTTRSPWSELDAPQPVVEKMATAAVAKMLKVPDIDWTKHMLVVVTAGSKPTGGWKVRIDSVKQEGKGVKVEFSITPPAGAATDAFTHPGELVLVERADGPAIFVEAKKKDAKGE